MMMEVKVVDGVNMGRWRRHTVLTVTMLEREFWYGGEVQHSEVQPFDHNTVRSLDLALNMSHNQMTPLLLSNQGRVIYAPDGMSVTVADGRVTAACAEGGTICFHEPSDEAEATLAAAFEAFAALRREELALTPSAGDVQRLAPFYSAPIYNTWIELTYDQRQEKVLEYARGIIAAGLPPGVLMIDDGWAENYGDYRFHEGRFPRPRELFAELHAMDFQVMLWVSPYVTADTAVARALFSQNLLLLKNKREPWIVPWWNGCSAALDLTRPAARDWFQRELDGLLALGADGFKFDGADPAYYLGGWDEAAIGAAGGTAVARDYPAAERHLAEAQLDAWTDLCASYAYNELRVSARAAGRPIFFRLCDKHHSWGYDGLASLCGDTLLQGLTGHPFACPDMIGGGDYLSFNSHDSSAFDAELFMRYAEASILLPCFQFSAAPWRLLDEAAMKRLRALLRLRQSLLPEIAQLWREAERTLRPLARSLEFVFPRQGFERCLDCFMLGDSYLVAPILEKGAGGRGLRLPTGYWTPLTLDETGILREGERLEGGYTHEISSAQGLILLRRVPA